MLKMCKSTTSSCIPLLYLLLTVSEQSVKQRLTGSCPCDHGNRIYTKNTEITRPFQLEATTRKLISTLAGQSSEIFSQPFIEQDVRTNTHSTHDRSSMLQWHFFAEYRLWLAKSISKSLASESSDLYR